MNLADNPGRSVRQQEQIGRRASIIEERRDTRAPQLEPQQDLRSARRGDVGGADALLRTLGLVENAGNDLQAYLTNDMVEKEKQNIAQGELDAQRGTVDDEMMQRSLGYQNAVTKGRTVSNFAEATRKFDDELTELIEGQDSPILEERLAEVNGRIESFFKDFAQDPETGQLRDYLQSPGAMRYLASAIQTTRPKALAAAQEKVEEGFKREAFSHFNRNVTDQAIETGTVDLAAARSLLPPIVTDEEFAENSLISVANAARALEEEGRLVEAAGLLAGLRQRTRTPVETGIGRAAPTGTPAASGAISATGTAASFATAFEGIGLSAPVIAGFLGNIEHESSFDGSRVGDNGTAFGHVQWREDRVENFQRVVGVHPKDATPEQSVQFIKWELDNPAKAGMTKKQRDAILNAETPEEAARAIDKFYERSNGRSTRDRMAAARRYFAGEQPVPAAEATTAAAPAAPTVRLRDPNADPLTLFEQSGEMVDIVGIEDVQFTPEQVARLDALYDQATDRMRRAWLAKRAEDQSVNAANLALGLSGLTGTVTTLADVATAFENDQIGPEEATALAQLIERQKDRREAALDRADAQAEREEARREKRRVERGAEVIIGKMARGEIAPAVARSAAIQFAAGVDDPTVGIEVLGIVNSTANAYESAIAGSEPARKKMAEFEDMADDPAAGVMRLKPDLPAYRAQALAPQYTAIVNRAAGRYARDLANGVDPATAAKNADTFLLNEQAKMIETLNLNGSGPNTGR
jgi:hypothetical protein